MEKKLGGAGAQCYMFQNEPHEDKSKKYISSGLSYKKMAQCSRVTKVWGPTNVRSSLIYTK